MNDKQFENKVNQDIDKTKKDIATLGDDGLMLGDDGVNGLRRMLVQGADDAKKTVDDTVKNVNEAVGQGLKQYNTKVQELAERAPGDFAKKAAKYPWVTITLSLAVGLLLGNLLKPGRQPAG